MTELHYKVGSSTEQTMMCRDRYGMFNASFFHIWACFLCYKHLFQEKHGVAPSAGGGVVESEDRIPSFSLFSEVHNMLCATPDDLSCQRLTSCCQAASQCCNKQISATLTPSGESTKQCPMTWDGYACFHPTTAGQVAQVKCPKYISERTLDNFATKQCLENGTWSRQEQSDLEWTDYTKCVSIEIYYLVYYVGISCSVGSLICLVPASFIFIYFKQLRKQHRIHIHLNLFASFTLTNCVLLTWDHLIYKDRLENPREIAILHQHIAGCRALYIFSRYSWTCNFTWMSLEGFHLHRLIHHAFLTPKSIISYYFIGWILPMLPTCVYSLVRILLSDEGCWVNHDGLYEWIMYCPNILCLLCNIFFLINVLRVLLSQLQRHSNEPSNFRRGLRATLIMVPLFGLQLLLVIYRPGDDIERNIPFEIFAKIINNSQGIAVTIVFCFMNGEVHSLLRSYVLCSGQSDHNPDIISGSVSVADVRGRSYGPGGVTSRLNSFSLRRFPAIPPSNEPRGAAQPNLTGLPSAMRRPHEVSVKSPVEENRLISRANI